MPVKKNRKKKGRNVVVGATGGKLPRGGGMVPSKRIKLPKKGSQKRYGGGKAPKARNRRAR